MSDLSELELETELQEEQDSGVYLSIGDLMSGLLMFFALLFITVMVQLKQVQDRINELPNQVIEVIRELPRGDQIKIDSKTGDVSIPDAILFDKGSAELKPQGKEFLKLFIPKYTDVIFSNSTFEDSVIRVIIEGQTSYLGDDQYNMDLSFKRSLSVYNYIFSKELNFKNKSKFKTKLMAAGRGEVEANQKIDDPRDRRVVFRFQLKQIDWDQFLKSSKSQSK
ncbi:MAG TPA: OmpA family protein [Candidatus Obscuribacterales bacterium]